MIKLHLGCGKRDFGSDWIHIDGGDFPHLHSHDITKLPFEDNSVDLIYNCHVLPYFDRVEAKEVLKEWYRVLKPNGIIRTAVNNFEVIAELYTQGKFKLEKFLGPLFGKWSMADQSIYHKTVYDFEHLCMMLESVGFHSIHKYDWRETEHAQYDDHSQAFLPAMNKDNGTLISLNVEGYK